MVAETPEEKAALISTLGFSLPADVLDALIAHQQNLAELDGLPRSGASVALRYSFKTLDGVVTGVIHIGKYNDGEETGYQAWTETGTTIASSFAVGTAITNIAGGIAAGIAGFTGVAVSLPVVATVAASGAVFLAVDAVFDLGVTDGLKSELTDIINKVAVNVGHDGELAGTRTVLTDSDGNIVNISKSVGEFLHDTQNVILTSAAGTEIAIKRNDGTKTNFVLQSSENIEAVATAMGVTVPDLLAMAANDSWNQGSIEAENGGSMYIAVEGDNILNITPTDNDFDYVGVNFRYDPEADNPIEQGLQITMASASVTDAATAFATIPTSELKPSAIEFTDGDGNMVEYKTYDSDVADTLDQMGGSYNTDDLFNTGDAENPFFVLNKTANTLVEGVSYLATEVIDTTQAAAEAVVTFVAGQVDVAATWFTDNAFSSFSGWFSTNLGDIVSGNLSVDEGLISLAEWMGTEFVVDHVGGQIADALQAKAYIADVLETHLGVENPAPIVEGIGDIFSNFATNALLNGGNWDGTDYAHAGVAAISGVVANHYSTQIWGDKSLPWNPTPTSLSAGAGAAIANLAIEALTSDLFKGYDSGQWLQLGATTGVAFAVGATTVSVTKLAAGLGNIIAPGIGAIAGAVIGLVAGKLIGSLFGSQVFYAGEAGDPRPLLDSLYQVQTIDGVPTLVATSANGSTIIASGITQILGGTGQDVLVGNDGAADTIIGGAGSDYVEGQAGDDQLIGEAGSDHLSGGAGDDFISGGDGDDIIFGDAGNDTVVGDAGDDFVHLGSGDDAVATGDGRDMVMGGSGNDSIQTDAGDDIVDGGSGDDIIETGTGDDLALGNLGNDTIILSDGNDIAFGDLGNDQLYGGSGNDILVGGEGVDLLHGENGADILLGEAGNDFLDGGIGDDDLSGGTGEDVLLGGMDDDLLQGDEGDDSLSGGFGNDILIGGQGADSLEGEDGDDIYAISNDAADINNIITDTAGNDTLVLSWLTESNISNLAMTQAGDDLVIDYNGNNVATIANHFNGMVLETLEIENGKTLDLTGLTVTAGVVTTPTVNAASGASKQSDIDARLAAANTTLVNQETFFSNTLTNALSDAAYQEILEDEFLTEQYNQEIVTSFRRDRGKCGGSYTVYRLDRIGELDGTNQVQELFELLSGFDPLDYDKVVNNADKVESSFQIDYDTNPFNTVAATVNITDYYENGDRAATTYTITQNGIGTVLEQNQTGESTVLVGDGSFTESDRLAAGTLTQVTLGIRTLQSGSDKLVGAWWSEVITGGSGSDVIVGNGGDDTLDGGSGNDWIFGGGGNDTIYGRFGDDIIFGSDGNDILNGNEDEDAILAGAGHDVVYGGAGDDWIEGGSGNDIIYAGSDADAAFGGDGQDILYGNEGNDLIDGGNGNDVIYGNDGSNLNTFIEGVETRANTYTSGDQRYSQVTALNDGGYVIVWESNNQDGSGYGVYGQRYDANGAKVGSEFRANTTTADTQAYAYVFALNDGGYMVTWSSNNQDGSNYGIYAQRYNADGTISGSEFRVNDTTTDMQRDPQGVQLDNGEIVFVWTSRNQDSSAEGIYLKHYDNTGTALSGEILANTTTVGGQYSANITKLNDGGFMILWSDYEPDAEGADVYGQAFDSVGAKVGSEFQVNTYTTGNQTVSAGSVATLSDGNVVAAWREYTGQDGDGNGVFAQIINADGTKMGEEFQVNTFTTSTQYDPSITSLADGGFLITWASYHIVANNPYSNDSDYAVMAQRFDAGGNKIGSEFQVNDYTTDWQYQPSVTSLSDGSIVFSWDSDGQDGSGYGIYTKKFTYQSDDDVIRGEDGNDIIHGDAGDDTIYGGDEILRYELVEGTEARANTYTSGDQRYSQVTALNDGGYVIVWESNNQDGSGYGVYGQRYDANGAKVGSEFRANTTTTDSQGFTNVFALNDGGYMVTWSSNNQDGSNYGIYAQRYNADGTISGSEFRVNDTTTDMQRDPRGVQLDNGEIVFVWTSRNQDGDDDGIYLKHYDNTGTVLSGEMLANTTTVGGQYSANITKLNDGGFMILWSDYEPDAEGADVYGQAFDSVGAKVGSEFQVNTYTTGNQTVSAGSVATLSDGNVVAAWREYTGQDGDGNGVFAQIVQPDGTKVGEEFQVNTFTDSTQYDPSITSLADGGFLITWASYHIVANNPYSNDSDYAVMAQRFDAEGYKVGNEFQINTHTSGFQFQPDVTTLSDGSLVFTWDSQNQDGSGYGVYTKKYSFALQDDGDVLYGDDGDDTLFGGLGNDTLEGGEGVDTLWGEEGDDSFIFTSISDSNATNGIDTIKDFEQGADVIDLVGLSLAGLIDLTITNDGTNTRVEDTNSDFEVNLDGVFALTEDDFIFS